ncbi:cytochrome b/b6 domain-containing protein [Vibrio hangzhouensis]|uniref:Cytochrome b n=1 Tax=Vibrio hangzhouensis TaxID=462991 RepID=A0A1H5T2C8_9VIBR|nr:cytochrome b/b6 domain-containing protein [Vibrio hangzhouensis]SEF56939.1 Cytochrome b [Vibrio hangzhouensis]
MENNPHSLTKVWDVPTRIFHWALVCLFLFLIVSGEIGNDWMRMHMLAGYLLSGLILFRFIWGVVGSYHARFSNFVRSPRQALHYLQKVVKGHANHYAGHNPAGAIMVIAMIVGLGIQALTGLVTTDDILWNGPLYHLVSADLREFGGTIHRLLEVGLKIIVALHVIAVLIHKFLLKEPLIAAMVHGRKPLPPIEKIVIEVRISLLIFAVVVSAGWVIWLWSLPI